MSTLKVNTLTDTAATKSVPIADVVNGTARAWVNFDGTGTVAIRGQYNVSSITDNGTGDYTINFTTAMPDANYAFVGCAGDSANDLINVSTNFAATTTAQRINTTYVNSTPLDVDFISASIFR